MTSWNLHHLTRFLRDQTSLRILALVLQDEATLPLLPKSESQINLPSTQLPSSCSSSWGVRASFLRRYPCPMSSSLPSSGDLACSLASQSVARQMLDLFLSQTPSLVLGLVSTFASPLRMVSVRDLWGLWTLDLPCTLACEPWSFHCLALLTRSCLPAFGILRSRTALLPSFRFRTVSWVRGSVANHGSILPLRLHWTALGHLPSFLSLSKASSLPCLFSLSTSLPRAVLPPLLLKNRSALPARWSSSHTLPETTFSDPHSTYRSPSRSSSLRSFFLISFQTSFRPFGVLFYFHSHFISIFFFLPSFSSLLFKNTFCKR